MRGKGTKYYNNCVNTNNRLEMENDYHNNIVISSKYIYVIFVPINYDRIGQSTDFQVLLELGAIFLKA